VRRTSVRIRSTVRRLVLAGATFGLGALLPGPRVSARMLKPRRYCSRSYFTKIAPEIYGGRFRTEPGLATEEVTRRIGRPPGYLGYTAQMLAITGYSTLPGLPFITARTLILAGDDDPIVPSPNQRVLARCIKNSQLHVIPGRAPAAARQPRPRRPTDQRLPRTTGRRSCDSIAVDASAMINQPLLPKTPRLAPARV
jgi:pimeloyl-ACP methyl ester carboxylesterase